MSDELMDELQAIDGVGESRAEEIVEVLDSHGAGDEDAATHVDEALAHIADMQLPSAANRAHRDNIIDHLTTALELLEA